jgi:hypothetical protein
LPAVIAWFAAVKKAGALQYANCPNIEFRTPLTHLPSFRLLSFPRSFRFVPLKPNQIPTMAFGGSFGTTGAAAGLDSLSITSGL